MGGGAASQKRHLHVTKHGRHLGRHLEFYKVSKKLAKNGENW